VIPKDASLPPWPKDVLKEWDQLTADEKKLFIRQAEVFAADTAYSDHEIGRVIQAFEDLRRLEKLTIQVERPQLSPEDVQKLETATQAHEPSE